MEYLDKIRMELDLWQRQLSSPPSAFDHLAARVQKKINNYIPEKVHNAVTAAIKGLVKTVLFGATHLSAAPPYGTTSLIHREALIKDRIDSYAKGSAAEGGLTGAGGFVTSMADFPILIGIKIKLLFEIATLYGFDISDFRERLYILHIFQLAFSSTKGTQNIYQKMQKWDERILDIPDADNFDWKTFQQEYRDYIDIAKLAQLLPVVGAAVGAIANFKLVKKLGKTAMQAYRMRLLGNAHHSESPSSNIP
ncbi:EcsC family protein [Pedobacter deserti]|uniref:EcsC family protein n=1 Tax=Pedobacter deserti TaxID=2817382 RepID=UPI00210C0773|nr:EcsC family protein [Pedobacter sp. SYSU D00382]